jgi:tetratricopeptide (TPR) repeat protein
MDDRPEREAAEGARLARRAVELGRDDAVALSRGGHALAHFTGDLDGGIALHDRAVMLNPNLAAAWFLGGFLRVWHGEPDGAIEHFARAMRLSPLDPETYRMQAGMAAAHLFAGRFDAASSLADKASAICRASCWWPASPRPATRWPAGPRKAAEPWLICASWILAAHFQSQGLASDPPGGRSRDVCGRLAQGRAAGIAPELA